MPYPEVFEAQGHETPLTQQALRRPNTQSKTVTDFVADLSSMTFDRLQTLCGSWRPLVEQDSVLVSLMRQASERHRKLSAAIHGLSVAELTDGRNSSLLIRIDAIEKQIALLAGKFGMTPADRVRMDDDSSADSQEATSFADMVDRAERLLALSLGGVVE
jgi:hypothetical protein